MCVKMRPVTELDGSRYVFLQGRGEQGKLPLLVLDKGRSAPVAQNPEVRANRPIVDRAPVGHKQRINFNMAIAELDGVARGQPIAAGGLNAGSVAANPIAHKHAAIGVQVVIEAIPVDEFAGRVL